MNLGNPIHRMIAARVAGAFAAAAAALLFAWFADGADRWYLQGAYVTGAIGFVYWSYLAWRGALRMWLRTRRCPSEPVPVSPEIWAAFMAVVERARQMEREGQADRYQELYEADWDRNVDEAGARVHAISEVTGRSRNYDHGTAWIYLDELCGIVGGASDVASAVLVRDVIDPADYDLLTEWWVKAGLPLEPHQATVSTSPAGR